MTTGLANTLMLDLAATEMRSRHRDAQDRAARAAARRGRVRAAITARTR